MEKELVFSFLLALVVPIRGDIGEKLRQGILPVGQQLEVEGLDAPFKPIIPFGHHHAEDENNLERLCNDPFHSFLCKPAGPRVHHFDGRIREGAVLPPNFQLNGAASNSDPSRTGSSVLPTSQEEKGYSYPKPQKGYDYPKPPAESRLELPKPERLDKPSGQPTQLLLTSVPKPSNEYLPSIGSPAPKPTENIPLSLPFKPIARPPSVPIFTPIQHPPIHHQPVIPIVMATYIQPHVSPIVHQPPLVASSHQVTYNFPKPVQFVPPQYVIQYPKVTAVRQPIITTTQTPFLFSATTARPPLIPAQTVTTGYTYPKPVNFISTSTQRPPLIPAQTVETGYVYPKPTNQINFISSPISTPKPITRPPLEYLPSSNVQPLPVITASTEAPIKLISRPVIVPQATYVATPQIIPKPQPIGTSQQVILHYISPVKPTPKPQPIALPSNEYLPAPVVPLPKPTNNVNIAIPAEEGYKYPKPSNQYLPSLEPQGTNVSPSLSGQASLPLENDDTRGQDKKPKHERTHTLEELCNDAFHSFLCKPIDKPRRRIDGNLRPGAKVPPEVLQRLSSNVRGVRTFPNQQGSASLSSQLENSSVKRYPYDIPQGLPFASTNLDPLFQIAASDSSALAKKGYSYPKPKKPLVLPSTSSTPKAPVKGYKYPKPENPLTIPTTTTTKPVQSAIDDNDLPPLSQFEIIKP